jgi:hypothetical protein
MSELNIHLKIKINFTVILIAVLFIHVGLFLIKKIPSLDVANNISATDRNGNAPAPIKLNVRPVKTMGVTSPNIKPMESILNDGAPKKVTQKGPGEPSPTPSHARPPVSLKDLSVAKNDMTPPPTPKTPKIQRPGARPEVTVAKPKAMNAISLKSAEFRDISKAFPSGGLSISDMMSGAQKVSDAVVSIEVPEGINPDELNEYELMFYGFQKRTAMNYVNSIIKNLDRFQKAHPNYRLSTERITMTARISYDREGNVKQIKMIRWTHVNEMQGLFEDIVKSIDQLHNPPKALWERDGEFAMFYTLEILNG